jgi:YtkA-like protein
VTGDDLRNSHHWLLTVSRVSRCMPLLVGLIFCIVPLAVLADGGFVRVNQAAGPFVVTVFSAPTPLQVGPADFSVYVQSRDTKTTVLDADVVLRFAPRTEGATPFFVTATHEAATNKFLYAATLNLPTAGTWHMHLIVRHPSGEAEADATLVVESSARPLASFWPYFLLPPVAVAAFALHQWLHGRRPRQPSEGK